MKSPGHDMDFVTGLGWAKEKEWSHLQVRNQRKPQSCAPESRHSVFAERCQGTALGSLHSWWERYE